LRAASTHQATFAEIVRDGLFDVHVLAGRAREDRGRPVPVIGCGDHDGVHVFVVQHTAQVVTAAHFAEAEFFG